MIYSFSLSSIAVLEETVSLLPLSRNLYIYFGPDKNSQPTLKNLLTLGSFINR